MDYFDMRKHTDHVSAQEIKDQHSIVAVIEEHINLKKVGNLWVGLCPFHDDHNPSLKVDERRQDYRCYACGAHGDAITFIRQLHDVGFYEAMMILQYGKKRLPNIRTRPITKESDKKQIARRYWRSSGPIDGTPAELYLESRYIPVEFARDQGSLRFSRLTFDNSVAEHPVLIAAFQNLHGDVVAVQRIYLNDEGKKLQPDCKRSLAPIAGAAIKLNMDNQPETGPEHIILCEGLEDGLSLARLNPEDAVWVAGGAGNMQKVELPPSCKSVSIAGDNDVSGRRASEATAERLIKTGIVVDHFNPPRA